MLSCSQTMFMVAANFYDRGSKLMPQHTEPFLERLARGPILCDGAMGTLLYGRMASLAGHAAPVCFDDLNRSRPDLVQTIHQEYIAAGAQIIETNTFGANGHKLGGYGLGNDVRLLNMRGVRLAREAREVAGLPVFIAGAVGPSGLPLLGSLDDAQRAELRALFRAQIDALLEGGVDLIVLETFSNLEELTEATRVAREASDLPVVAQLTFSEDGRTLAGATPADVVRTLIDARPHVIGANCGMGPDGTLDVVTDMAVAIAELPAGVTHPVLSALPNAGLPSRVEGRYLYVSTPDYFADYARRFLDVGVGLVGGCCGTTPRHILAMRDVVTVASPQTFGIPAVLTEKTRVHSDEDSIVPQVGTTTRLQQALEAGKFVVSVELDPPKGLNPSKVLAGAGLLRERGVKFINIADSPTARVRMSCISLARLIRDMFDIEPIIHCTTRDRNIMALQSDLLGAHALDLRNVLALTGDPMRVGEYPNLTGVWDIDSIGLVSIMHGMNAGHDAGGAPLGGQASFYIGAALDVNVADCPIDIDIERARHKLEGAAEPDTLTEQSLEFGRYQAKVAAGAGYIMTQFIYDLEPLRQFYANYGKPSVPLILGMSPLYSYKHAEFLHNEIRGITIPLAIRERMRAAGDRAREVGLEIAYELISTARNEGLIQGCYLLPSYGRYDLVAELAASFV
jgi:methionine synthase / methylenetetrahydrofolate reductase(NADPH)